jgi:hypothetical protein
MSAEQATKKLMGIDDPDFDAGTGSTSRDHKTLGHLALAGAQRGS